MTDTARTDEDTQIYEDFNKLVNMTSKQLDDWLRTDESQTVGIEKGTTNVKKKDAGDGESTGHESGRKIVDIQNKSKSDLNDEDYAHMKRVNGYIKRHLAQKPSSDNDVEHSRWRYSLMNWGHDPLK